MAPPGSGAGRRSPQRHAQPAHAAGTPTTIACGATSCLTTAPAPTNAYSPIVTPQITVALAPMVAPFLTWVATYSARRDTCARACTTLVNVHDGPRKTSSSIVTPS